MPNAKAKMSKFEIWILGFLPALTAVRQAAGRDLKFVICNLLFS